MVDSGVRMKVLVVNNAWYNTGVGNYIFNIFKILKRTMDIEMVYLYSKFPPKIYERKIRIITNPFRKLKGGSELGNFFFFPSRLKHLRNEYDLFHISNETIVACTKFIRPTIITVMDVVPLIFPREYDRITTFFRKLHFKFLRIVDRIIAISLNTKKDLINLLGVKEEKISVIYYGIDHNKFRRLKIEKDYPLSLLNVSLDIKRKNFGTVLKVLFLLRKWGLKIRLLKIGGINRTHRNMIKKLGLENSVIDLGFIPNDELPYYYNLSHIFIFPSLYEGFGLPLLEAMACGVPIVASNCSSIPEVVGTDYKFLFDPRDVHGMAKTCKELLEDEGLRRYISRKLYKRSFKFSWYKTAKATKRIYKELYMV